MYEAAIKIDNLILRAAFVARIAHDKQLRKHTKRPYVTHPARVAAMAAIHPLADEVFVAAAFLHDCDEDTWVKIDLIESIFGPEVAGLVKELTNPSKKIEANRRTRKQIDLDHLRTVSKRAKVLKLLDRIDNLLELKGADMDFQRLYARESEALAEAIGDADPELKKELLKIIAEIQNGIRQ